MVKAALLKTIAYSIIHERSVIGQCMYDNANSKIMVDTLE